MKRVICLCWVATMRTSPTAITSIRIKITRNSPPMSSRRRRMVSIESTNSYWNYFRNFMRIIRFDIIQLCPVRDIRTTSVRWIATILGNTIFQIYPIHRWIQLITGISLGMVIDNPPAVIIVCHLFNIISPPPPVVTTTRFHTLNSQNIWQKRTSNRGKTHHGARKQLAEQRKLYFF